MGVYQPRFMIKNYLEKARINTMGYTFSTRRLIQLFENPFSLTFHHPKKRKEKKKSTQPSSKTICLFSHTNGKVKIQLDFTQL
jgi:hypothetical protein